MSTPPEDIPQAFADAITRSDVEAGVALCHPEVEFTSMLDMRGRAYRGHQGIREYFDDIESAWSEWKVELHEVAVGEDGRVALVMTMHVRGKGSGATLTDTAAHVWTLRDGRLWRNRLYREPQDALRDIGAEA